MKAGFNVGRASRRSPLSRKSATGWKPVLLWLALFLAPLGANAQSYSIDWFTIDGGGGTSTGGVYSVSGTIGQPDAGKSSGGSYVLEGGFWNVAVAIQTPGGPLLTITRSGSNVILSWPGDSAGFVLQETTLIADPNSWQDTSTSPVVVGPNITVTVPGSPGFKFYRLRKP